MITTFVIAAGSHSADRLSLYPSFRTGYREEDHNDPNYIEMEITSMITHFSGSMAALYAIQGTMKKGGPCRQHEDDQTDRKHNVLRRSRLDRKRYAIFRG